MSWAPPQIREKPPEAEQRALDPLDHATLAARLGPEFSRLAGTRVSVRPTQDGDNTLDGAFIGLTNLAVPESRTTNVALSETLVDLLLGRIFGARLLPAGGKPLAPARELAPGTATWATLASLFSTVLVTALAESGVQVVRRPAFPLRATDAPAPTGAQIATFRVEVDETSGWLRLAAWPADPKPREDALETLKRWRRRAAASAQRVPIKVALRLPDRQVALTRVLTLRPGDILPLERPRTLTLIINGQPVTSLLADRFLTRMEEPE